MSLFTRLAYRVRQFWLALKPANQPVPEETLQAVLAPGAVALFRCMSPSEQVHSLAVLRRLQEAGHTNPDLLTAALLHDVGKSRSPLTLVDRALIVLGRRFFPKTSRRWGEGRMSWLRRPFVVARRHPEWGAGMARLAGVSERACDLILRHQDLPEPGETLLPALRLADDKE
jgi:putative nucleotidyltransferase with HDIG domain